MKFVLFSISIHASFSIIIFVIFLFFHILFDAEFTTNSQKILIMLVLNVDFWERAKDFMMFRSFKNRLEIWKFNSFKTYLIVCLTDNFSSKFWIIWRRCIVNSMSLFKFSEERSFRDNLNFLTSFFLTSSFFFFSLIFEVVCSVIFMSYLKWDWNWYEWKWDCCELNMKRMWEYYKWATKHFSWKSKRS